MFTYNDIVKIRNDALRVDSRRGEIAWIVGITKEKRFPIHKSFPEGIIYLVEFEDGDAIEVHESEVEQT